MPSSPQTALVVSSLFVLFALASSACPSKCTCTKHMLNCTNAGLHRIPNLTQLYPFQPLVIDLSYNKILAVRSDDFGYLESQKLKNLYLNDNQILDVHELAFRYLTSATEISLARNQLEEVPATMVANCRTLFLLDLSGNYFAGSTPQLYSESLEVLDLSSSKVKRFTKEHVKYLKALKILSLRGNSLKGMSMDVFDGLDLHYVDVGLNTWECGNATVELFDFLTSRNLTLMEKDEPVKCLANDKTFRVIYNSNGPVALNPEDLPLNTESSSLLAAFDYDQMVEDEAELDYSYEYADSNDEEVRTPYFSDPKKIAIPDGSDEETEDSDEDDVLLPLKPKNKIEYIVLEPSERPLSDVKLEEENSSELKFEGLNLHIGQNIFVFLGLLALTATFLTGILLGFGIIKRKVSKRRIEDNNSTTKLVLLDE